MHVGRGRYKNTDQFTELIITAAYQNFWEDHLHNVVNAISLSFTLNVSSSQVAQRYTVLRPIGKVNGEAQILTPCKIYTP